MREREVAHGTLRDVVAITIDRILKLTRAPFTSGFPCLWVLGKGSGVVVPQVNPTAGVPWQGVGSDSVVLW